MANNNRRRICFICDGEDGKYKCNKCMVFYCSVNCYKIHNEQCKGETTNEFNDQHIVEDRTPDTINLFTTIDTVPAEKLQHLESSDKLKDLLRNPHLRDFLVEVNSSKNSWNAMKLAMMEPLFVEFADACLEIVENDEKTE